MTFGGVIYIAGGPVDIVDVVDWVDWNAWSQRPQPASASILSILPIPSISPGPRLHVPKGHSNFDFLGPGNYNAVL